MQDEGDLHNPLIDRFGFSLDEFFDEGQAGGHVDIRAAGMQVRQDNLEEFPVGRFHHLQVLVTPGQIDQVMQIGGSQAGLLRQAQLDIVRDPGGLAVGEGKLDECK